MWKEKLPVFDWNGILVIAALGIPFRFFVQLYFFSETGDSMFATVGMIPSVIYGTGLVFTCTLLAGRQQNYRVAGQLFLVVYSSAGLLTGQRADALLPWFIMGLSRLQQQWWRRESLRRAMMTLAGFGLLVVLLFPILTFYKSAMGGTRAKVSGMTRLREGLGAWQDVLKERSLGRSDGEESGIGTQMVLVSRRLSQLMSGAFIVTKAVDVWGPLQGESLYQAVIAFMPRFVWHDKPEIGLGPRAYNLMGFDGPGSAEVPMAADWYLNFGFPGVLLGMPFIGALYALTTFFLSRNDPLTCSLLAFLSMDFMRACTGIATVLFMPTVCISLVMALRHLVTKRHG